MTRQKKLDPEAASAHARKGQAALSAGHLHEAVASFRRSLRAAPLVDVHILLGRALRELGHEGSTDAFGAALVIAPTRVDAHNGLGLSLVREGRTAEALESFHRALELDVESNSTRFNLATLLASLGRHDEAAVHLGILAERSPADADVQNAYGAELEQLGRTDEALVAYRAAGPTAAALFNQARLLVQRGSLAAAERVVGVLVDLPLTPRDRADALDLRAGIWSVEGRALEAIEEHRRALEADPLRPELHSNLLLAMQYEPPARDAHFEAHREWAARHAPVSALPFSEPLPPASPLSESGRTLPRLPRLGFVSADLRYHSVAYFLEPLLRGLAGRAEVVLYSNSRITDSTTARLRSYSSEFRVVADLDDSALAATIASDALDVVIDLAGHTGGNRLRALALRPAPRIATYLGYPDTTGLPFDLRITDALADPPGAERYHTEVLARLDGGFLCYRPDADAPDPRPPPCFAKGTLTFGSFNTTSKLTPRTLALWARVLEATGARLFLKAPSFENPATAARTIDAFERHGIERTRVELCGFVASTREHLERYGTLDIALDPTPYVGATTTCEALWMGVPVVSLVGENHASRVGLSVLTRVGLADLAVGSEEAYVRVAATLASDRERLATLRHELRPRMAASPLCDETRIAEQFLRAVLLT